MKVTPFKDLSIQQAKNVSSVEKPFYKLSEGEIFKAQIIDIQHGKILLKLNDHFSIEAKLQNQLLEMKIGQMLLFKVQSNANDQILIEILKNQNEDPKLNVVLDALNAAKLMTTPENVKLVETLLDNQLPIDSSSLQNVFHQIKNHPNISLEEIVFFLNNEIEIDEKNIFQLNGYIKHSINLEEQVGQLLDRIENMKDVFNKVELIKSLAQAKDIPDSAESLANSDSGEKVNHASRDLSKLAKEIEVLNELKNKPEFLLKDIFQKENDTFHFSQDLNPELKAILSNDEEISNYLKTTFELWMNANDENEISEKAKEGLEKILSDKVKTFLHIIRNDIHIPLEDLRNQEKLKEVYNKLYKYVLSLDNTAHKMDSAQGKEIAETSQQIKDHLDFMNQLSKFQSYIQIPIKMDRHNAQADLYVFRKKKNKKNDAQSISALIALDLAKLGYMEAFVQKNGKDVYCQFRLENENYKGIFQKYSQKLTNALLNKGYNLKSISFHSLKERFNIIKSPGNDITSIKEEPKRYSFDMRV